MYYMRSHASAMRLDVGDDGVTRVRGAARRGARRRRSARVRLDGAARRGGRRGGRGEARASASGVACRCSSTATARLVVLVQLDAGHDSTAMTPPGTLATCSRHARENVARRHVTRHVIAESPTSEGETSKGAQIHQKSETPH